MIENITRRCAIFNHPSISLERLTSQMDGAAPVTFKQVVPRTRKERRDRASKETLEKSRLENRRECHFQYTNLGKLTEPEPNTLQSCTDAERFSADCAGVFKNRREEGLKVRKERMDTKRAMMIEREEVRWAEIDREQTAEDVKWNHIRELGERNRRNTSSVPYNPISLSYNDNVSGDLLRHSDNMVRYRGAQRAFNLRSRDTCGFNPITGTPGEFLEQPVKPVYKPKDRD